MIEELAKNRDKWLRLTPKLALYDRTLVWLFFSLLIFGFIMVTSASIPISAKLFGEPFHFAVRDGGYAIISLCVFTFSIQISSQQWEKYNVLLFGIAILLLFIVLIIGHSVNGATRWIPLGYLNFQPAELAKFAVICYFSSFYVRKFDEMRIRRMSFVRPMVILSIFSVLLILQPDLGSTVVIFILTFAMLFIMGAKMFQFVILGVTGIGLLLFSILSSAYRLKRVTSYLDPWADAYGDGFQLTNSQMAFGRGELFGQGLGNSIQKLGYLPEAHTDFVMAVVGEELGFIGIVGITLLLILLALRALKVSRESLLLEERFKGFFAFGIAIWIFLQGFVNLGVASGLLPTKGLTFPLVSYGGSSLMIMSIVIAVLVRIDYENRLANIKYANPKNN